LKIVDKFHEILYNFSIVRHQAQEIIMNTLITDTIKNTKGRFFKISTVALGTGRVKTTTVRLVNTKLFKVPSGCVMVYDAAEKKNKLILISSIRKIIIKNVVEYSFYKERDIILGYDQDYLDMINSFDNYSW
jgi:hypothetical protein